MFEQIFGLGAFGSDNPIIERATNRFVEAINAKNELLRNTLEGDELTELITINRRMKAAFEAGEEYAAGKSEYSSDDVGYTIAAAGFELFTFLIEH